MLFFGHIAVSVAVADATDSDVGAAIAGNLLPDVADKTGGWVLGVMPSGRWLAHGLPFFALSLAVASRVVDGRAWRGFALGYASHLVGDLWGGGRLPLFAPFDRPLGSESRHDFAWLASNLGPEVAGLAYLVWRRRRRT
jgi:hypothetical protein